MLTSVVLTRMASYVVSAFSRARLWRSGTISSFPLSFTLRGAHPAARVRLSCRTFGVRFSIPGPTLTWMIRDGFRAGIGIPLFGLMSAFYLPMASFMLGILLATPLVRRAYESGFEELGHRGQFYFAIFLFVFAVCWWPLELRRIRGVAGEESFRRAFYLCCRCIDDCLRTQEGEVPLLHLDREIHRFGLALVRFGKSGLVQGSPERKRQLLEHTTRVSAALDASAERLLRDGEDAIPDMVRCLVGILERLADEKWLNLVDETELPTYQPPSSEEMESEIRRADGRIVLVGATAAAILVGVMIALGVPAGAVIPAALIFLLGPASIWGSKKLGSPREMLDALRSGVTQPTEPQQPTSAPSAPSLPSPTAPVPHDPTAVPTDTNSRSRS